MKIVKSLLALSILLSFNAAQAATKDIEVVAELSNTRPGNLTITPNGRMILSQQPLDNPELRVVELMANGSLQPFPTLDWADGPEKGEVGFAAVIGVHTTKDGIVWVLDMGSATSQPKLVAWDSVKNSLFKIIPIDKSALAANSFLQDFAIDEQRNKIYIADTTLGNLVGLTKPAFVVVDLESGQSRRVLEANAKLMPPKHEVIIDGSSLGTQREDGTKEAIYLGLNPITIDSENNWVYFGTVNGSDLFRIPTNVLADEHATDTSLSASIELFGQKRPSDGIIIDDKGNVYTGDIENSAIGVVNKTGYSVLAQDKTLLSWPDGFAIDNGWLYITQNQLHLTAPLNEGEAQGTKPYRILRIKLPE
jgi:sugar lactone lactonase YvrE